MQTGLAILTFVPDRKRPEIPSRLPLAIRSLEQTEFDGPVFVVDDCSGDERHLDFLQSLPGRYQVVRRGSNGGVWRGKNTCLRVLAERGVEVGFVAEDDIEFRPGWHDRYSAAHRAIPHIHHYSWAWDDDPSGRMRKRRRTIDGYTIAETSRVNGVLLTFTPEVLRRVGGFKPLPAGWGHTHTNWTRRIINSRLAPFFADVVDSNRYIRLGRFGAHSAISDDEKRKSEQRNRRPAGDLSQIFYPIEE